jgi:CDP-6-deoxy-D-xylo-4-hexulose-3-dehydrase
MPFKYPLQVDPFTWSDKAKVARFILAGNRLTQGVKVKEYESIWEKKTGAKYAVFVNSGSSANFLVAQRLKDKLVKSGQWNKKKMVIFPALTWSTSITPFVLLGFEPYFIDIDPRNWGLDFDLTYQYLMKNESKVAAVFPTALLGMGFDSRFFILNSHFKIEFLFDGCEASFNHNGSNNYLVSKATSTTSSFFAHYANSIEGGVIFCNNEEDYAWYLMARNHGLTRALLSYADKLTKKPSQYSNPDVHPEFDFNIVGSNFRNTDINAYFGILDSKRWNEMLQHRYNLGLVWEASLHKGIYYLPGEFVYGGNVPFALPVVSRNKAHKEKAQAYLNTEGIESRPIISGSLSRQTPFKQYMKGQFFPIAEFLHENGLYIGLNTKLKIADVEWIAKGLNSL